MAKVLIPLARGFEEIEAVTVIDVIRRGGVEVVTASIETTLEVMGAHGIEMKADSLFADVADGEFDAIILPGGGEGTERLKDCKDLKSRLIRQRDDSKLVCAICAAPTVLVEAGVLFEETHITCYPTCQLELDREWASAPVVEDGNFITGQAPGSAMLFAFVVLQRIIGERSAAKVARSMVTDVLNQ